MSDLVEFLRARLDEDDQVARDDDRHWSDVPSALFSGRRAASEVQAKRTIVEVLEQCTNHSWTGTWAVVEEARRALRALAQPYADHPDYDPAWAPQESSP